jgi:hypothetical protein
MVTSNPYSPAGLYFGTSRGTAYSANDAGESRDVLAANAPPVYSVSIAKA